MLTRFIIMQYYKSKENSNFAAFLQFFTFVLKFIIIRPKSAKLGFLPIKLNVTMNYVYSFSNFITILIPADIYRIRSHTGISIYLFFSSLTRNKYPI